MASESIESKAEDINYIREIDRGGFGIVWEAEWNGMKVAVKKLYEQDQTEIDTLSTLEHENIIKLFSHRIEEQATILILEYADGGSLRSFLENSDPISQELYFRWAKETALPVEYLEQKHALQHMDIKTPNIMIKNNVLKLADFGSAKKVDRSHTTSQVGTERWMAPEAMRERHVSLTNNVYSVGLVLWELLTRELPFKKYKIPFKLMQAVIERKERPPIPPFCPAGLAELISKCWDDDPKKRPKINFVVKAIDEIKMQVLSSGRSQKSTEEKDVQTDFMVKLPCESVDQGNQTSDENQRKLCELLDAKLKVTRYREKKAIQELIIRNAAIQEPCKIEEEPCKSTSDTESVHLRISKGSTTVGLQKPNPRQKKKRRGGQDPPA